MKLNEELLVKRDENGDIILKDGKPIKISVDEFFDQELDKEETKKFIHEYVVSFVEQADKEADNAKIDFDKNKDTYFKKIINEMKQNDGKENLGEINCFDQHGAYYATMGMFIDTMFTRKLVKLIKPFKTKEEAHKFKQINDEFVDFNFVENAGLMKLYDKTIMIQDIYGQGEQFYQIIELKDYPENVDDLVQLEKQEFIESNYKEEFEKEN